jgi:glucokinase
MNVLAGDIGGTKTWLQIAECKNGKLNVLYEQRYASSDYDDFNVMLTDFFTDVKQAGLMLPTAGCIGVAGPVDETPQGGQVTKVTHLPWLLDTQKLSAQFGITRLRLINDFQAVGYGIEALAEDEISVLQAGEKPRQLTPPPQVLIGAGTGLGQGILIWAGDPRHGHYQVIASEGGHVDFAPGNIEQIELLSFLAQKNPRVAVEDVLSGKGLVNVYDFLADRYPEKADNELTQTMAGRDQAAAISKAALAENNPLATQALDLFIAIYGAQAGNLALTCMATGGVFIAGGVAPKIQSRMLHGPFVSAFCNKGHMSHIMKKIPIKIIMNPQVGLKGAALVASRL